MPNLPEIPLFDSVLGLLSALLLLAAAMYLVRARSSTAPGLTRLGSGSGNRAERGDLFAEFIPDATAHRLSFVASLFLHVLLVSLLPVAELLEPAPPVFDLNHYDVVILEYQQRNRPMNLPSDIADSIRPEPDKAETKDGDEPLGLPDAENEKTQQAQGPWEGPVLAVSAQPENPALSEAAAAAELPAGSGELPFPPVPEWSLQNSPAMALAQPQPARYVMEGAASSAQANVSLSDLGLSQAPRLDREAALQVPLGSLPGYGEVWNAFPGLMSPPDLFGSGGLLQGGGGGSGNDIVAALAFQLAMERGALGQFFAGRSMAALGGSGKDVPFRTGAAEGPREGGWGRGKLTPVPRSFHGIILVSNAVGTLPEAAGVLTGNPVYTVYVEVPDAPRKWILQFCVPNASESNVEFTGEIVRVLGRKSVNPPYALHKEPPRIEIIPTLERLAQLPQRVVAYATVDQEGNLHDLRMVSGADPETDRLILASLRNWEFTPAFRDGVPIEVEALFGIPLY